MLPWWAQFVGATDRVALKPEKSAYTSTAVDRAVHHLDRLMATLCVIRTGLGISLDQMCIGSEHRLTDKHRQKIEEIRRGLGE
jgi:hypothetical protein